MTLRTRRLVLRPVTAGDCDAVHAYRGDPEVVRFLTHEALSAEQTTAYLARAAAQWSASDDERFNLTLAVLLDGEVIGDVHVWNTDEPLQPASDDPREAWVGYVLDPRYQGQGLAGEALDGVLQWLAGRGIRRVYANTYCENAASARLLERFGFAAVRRFGPDEDGCGKGRASVRMGLDIGPAAAGWGRARADAG